MRAAMMTLNDTSSPSWGLPDPQTQPGFYASVPTKRFFAFWIDFLLVLVIAILIVPLTAFTGLFFFPFLMACVSFAYRTVTIANSSATLGMRLLGIEFRNDRGEKFDLGQAVLHTGLFHVWCMIPLLQLISSVLMLTTEYKQGLGDLILGSSAINRPSEH